MNPGKTAVMATLFIFFIVAQGFSAEVFFDITSSAAHKIDIALPYFNTPDDDAKILIETIHETFMSDLEFSGRFNVVDISQFFPNTKKEIVNPNFREWYLVGIQSLVTGYVKKIDGEIEMSIRLFDVPMGQQVVGIRYKAPLSRIKTIVHRFADEIQFRLTGEKGINDTRIAFTSNYTGHMELYVINPDGGNLQQLTDNDTINLSPAWFPDNTRIFLTSYLKGRPEMFSLALKSRAMKRIVQGGMNITPCVSRDGKRLVFSASYDGDPEITILNLETMRRRRITFSPGVDASPSFAPNGREIVFTSDRSGSPQLYIMDIDGVNVRRLTFIGPYNTSPDWSPRGDWIAYHSRRNGVFDIWLIHPDGSDEHPVTGEAGHNEDPTWARDGRHIAFISTRNGGKGLYVMDLTGRNVRQVLVNYGKCSNPSWSQ